jgi:hypothetical protein
MDMITHSGEGFFSHKFLVMILFLLHSKQATFVALFKAFFFFVGVRERGREREREREKESVDVNVYVGSRNVTKNHALEFTLDNVRYVTFNHVIRHGGKGREEK